MNSIYAAEFEFNSDSHNVPMKCVFSDMASINISEYKVDKAPATVYYIPNFISTSEEQVLLDNIYKVPKPKWTQLSNRRLQNWGGIPHPKGMVAEQIPAWLSMQLDKVWQLGVFKEPCKPNHVLVNEYLAGQGIMPHLDGPLFLPTITTLSLGSHTFIDFFHPNVEDSSTHNKAEKFLSLLLESRSLLILQDDMYSKYLHGIKEKEVDVVTSSEIANWNQCDISKRNRLKDVNNSLNSEDIVVGNDEGEVKYGDFNRKGISINPEDGASERECENSFWSKKATRDDDIVYELKRGRRISLTMRHVPKTSKVKLKLGR